MTVEVWLDSESDRSWESWKSEQEMTITILRMAKRERKESNREKRKRVTERKERE